MSYMDDLLKEIDSLDKETQNAFSDYEKIEKEAQRVLEITTNPEKYIIEIDNLFRKKTKLNKADISFLFLATGLQVLRQYILTPQNRVDDKTAAKKIHKENEEKNKLFFGKEDPVNGKQLYYAPMGDILDVNRYVPYDITNGSKKFNLGGSGKGLSDDHRYKVLGHDPILGLFYGTANILTNTITTYTQQSCHVKKIANSLGRQVPTIYAKADTLKIFDKTKERFQNDKPACVAALLKQIYHIKSDEITSDGIPLPFVGNISPALSKELAEYGIDWANTKLFSEQFAFAAIIDFIIAVLHRLLYDGTTDMDLKLYKVRTKKILDYSGIIASASNIISVSVQSAMGNENAINNLDLGGIAHTILKLIKDRNFITEIKREFLTQNFESLIEGDYNL
ncbi:hypothetical protein DXC27_10725 [Ruminococcus sp. OM08-7]|nr:hypothetical protein DXC27_10725 [Ruminococcus sp. OM08-7]